MKSIPIYIYDTAIKEKIQELIDENESLGFEKNKIKEPKIKYSLVNFNFNEEKLLGYWIDNSVNDDTQTLDIVFYISGTSFRTPYSEECKLLLNRLLSQIHY